MSTEIYSEVFCKISNFLDNQHQATSSMSCFINNQYHNVQGCIFFCIFVTLRQRQMNILDVTWAINQAYPKPQLWIRHKNTSTECWECSTATALNVTQTPTNQKTKKMALKKAQTAHPTEFWTVPHLINAIRPTQGVKQQIFRKIQTHGRRDSITVSTQVKLN